MDQPNQKHLGDKWHEEMLKWGWVCEENLLGDIFYYHSKEGYTLTPNETKIWRDANETPPPF